MNNKPKRGCLGRMVRWAIIGIVFLFGLGVVAQIINPSTPTPRPAVVNVINTAAPSGTPAPTDPPTVELTLRPSNTSAPTATIAPTSKDTGLLAFDKEIYEKEMTFFFSAYAKKLDVQLVQADQYEGKTRLLISYITKSLSKKVDYDEAIDLFRTASNAIQGGDLKVDVVYATVYDFTDHQYIQTMSADMETLVKLRDFEITDEAFKQILIKSAS